MRSIGFGICVIFAKTCSMFALMAFAAGCTIGADAGDAAAVAVGATACAQLLRMPHCLHFIFGFHVAAPHAPQVHDSVCCHALADGCQAACVPCQDAE